MGYCSFQRLLMKQKSLCNRFPTRSLPVTRRSSSIPYLTDAFEMPGIGPVEAFHTLRQRRDIRLDQPTIPTLMYSDIRGHGAQYTCRTQGLPA